MITGRVRGVSQRVCGCLARSDGYQIEFDGYLARPGGYQVGSYGYHGYARV